MDADLRRLREFGEELRPAADQPPADLRRRVLNQAAAKRRAPGLRWRPLVTAGVVAALALGVLVGPGRDRQDGTGTAPVTSAPVSTGAQTSVDLLRLAVRGVIAAPGPTARPDQFVYTESVQVRQQFGPDGKTDGPSAPLLVRQWQSVDGKREGLVEERPVDRPGQSWSSYPVPACRSCPTSAVAGLPTDGDAMHAYLYRPPGTQGELWMVETDNPDTRALGRVNYVLSVGQTSPAVQAAVFGAMERIPGVAVRSGAVDVAGRSGDALVYRTTEGETELIFDAESYRYLGMNRRIDNPRALNPGAAGITISLPIRDALLRVAVVDRTGVTQ